MAVWHKIVGGVIVKTSRYQPVGIGTDPNGDPYWRPEETVVTDTSTGPDSIRLVGALVIEPNRVVKPVTIRDLTAQEIDDRKANEVTSMGDVLILPVQKIINDIRALEDRLDALEGDTALNGDGTNPARTPLTKAQIAAWWKARL